MVVQLSVSFMFMEVWCQSMQETRRSFSIRYLLFLIRFAVTFQWRCYIRLSRPSSLRESNFTFHPHYGQVKIVLQPWNFAQFQVSVSTLKIYENIWSAHIRFLLTTSSKFSKRIKVDHFECLSGNWNNF